MSHKTPHLAEYRTCLCSPPNSALLLAFENGTKESASSNIYTNYGPSGNCNADANQALTSVLCSVTDSIEAFTLGTSTADYSSLAPFVVFLAFKSAALVTQRILTGDDMKEGLRQLRILRGFLSQVGQRWKSAGKLF